MKLQKTELYNKDSSDEIKKGRENWDMNKDWLEMPVNELNNRTQ